MRDLCVVIPTHERHHYLTRSIAYYSRFDCQVMVCDSSAEAYPHPVPANVAYHHLPGQRFPDKILHALALSSCQFLALSPDDDFLFEESLYKGVDALVANPRAQACVGDVLSFPDAPPFRIVSRDSGRAMVDALSDDALRNIRNYLFNYHQILWGLFRREALHKSFSVIAAARYGNENFFEVTIATLCAGSGGVHYLDDFWILRELSPSEHWGTRHRQIGREIDLKTDVDVAKFRRLIDAELFAGASDAALKAYLEGRPALQKFALLRRAFSRIAGLLPRKEQPPREIMQTDGDRRFAPIISAISK